MLGAIIGDIVGSRFEWHNHRSKDFELFTDACFPTDDSIMTLALAQAILNCKPDYSDLEGLAVACMQQIGRKYPDCGYGGRFRSWLVSEAPAPYNSFGNGAAMRVSPAGFAAQSLDEAKSIAHKITAVTHNHPEGLKGAEATAVALYMARTGSSMDNIREIIEKEYYPMDFTLDGIRDTYQFDESCQGTVPQALMAFFESTSFEDAIRNAISIGGDSDTLAAITGGIAEAYYGIPANIRKKAVTYLDGELSEILAAFESKYPPTAEKKRARQATASVRKAKVKETTVPKPKTPKKAASMEEALWKSADKLRGSVEPAEYKHVVLSLIFLKYASDRFEEQRKKIIAEGREKFVEVKAFYTKDNVFYLTPETRWSYIMEHAKQKDIALLIDTALFTIEKNNEQLKGALPDNYYSRLNLDTTKLASLLDVIDGIELTADKEQDIIGRVYEYFLSKFALKEGKGKGEFYTPKSIVNLIAELLEPYSGILYDPCCGSGGMFVQSIKFVEAHSGNKKNVSVYGQENIGTTFKLAKMNLAIRGISANLGEQAADTFLNDQHKDLRADYIMANPPFNQKDWRTADELTDDPRWDGYAVPPTSNANYGWILNIASKLSQNGTAGFLLANGALSDSGTELSIRRQLIENNLVEAILILPRNLFYTTDISVTLWVLNKNKKARTVQKNNKLVHYRAREREVLFMDLRQMGSPYEKKYVELTAEERKKVTDTFHAWQQDGGQYENVPEFCYSATFEEIKEKGFTLVPSRYIEFVNRDENIDYDAKMKALQGELAELLKQEEESKKDLLGVFKELGYEIKL